MDRKVIYPGTFDPITLGHIDVIERAIQLFGAVTVAITTNPQKKPLFSLKDRNALVRECTNGMNGVEVEGFSGLLVDYAEKKRSSIVLRGLRELSDFEVEFQQAIINRKLSPQLETVFIITNPKFFYLNSTVVKEIASLGGNVGCFVTPPVEKALRARFGKTKSKPF